MMWMPEAKKRQKGGADEQVFVSRFAPLRGTPPGAPGMGPVGKPSRPEGLP